MKYTLDVFKWPGFIDGTMSMRQRVRKCRAIITFRIDGTCTTTYTDDGSHAAEIAEEALIETPLAWNRCECVNLEHAYEQESKGVCLFSSGKTHDFGSHELHNFAILAAVRHYILSGRPPLPPRLTPDKSLPRRLFGVDVTFDAILDAASRSLGVAP